MKTPPQEQPNLPISLMMNITRFKAGRHGAVTEVVRFEGGFKVVALCVEPWLGAGLAEKIVYRKRSHLDRETGLC